ncbi:HotDog domain-containing protein [Gilbertella persicaria]|uniref:Thioesterase domain-containing protein n=1 Tax=Rhizopus stolonifer TaxID=4846 RepID=A0A367KJ46_RHIST|nr:HotDog domain-containing protein [Gilbertella persicaria]KAI8074285.1 HotDog domain-containing protein [Gilbertella persicaria]RCI02197.1 hypothetical protein CU098_011174 [Rhizopus stolonifer]
MKLLDSIAQEYPRLSDMVQHYAREKPTGPFCWEDYVGPNLRIIAAEPDKLTWEFKVDEQHCNSLGNLHGGCVATLIDICSSFAILVSSNKRQWQLIGISTDLSIAYLSGVAKDNVLRIECEIQRVGKTLANIFTKIYDQDNRLCYTGSHTKFNIDSRL